MAGGPRCAASDAQRRSSATDLASSVLHAARRDDADDERDKQPKHEEDHLKLRCCQAKFLLDCIGRPGGRWDRVTIACRRDMVNKGRVPTWGGQRLLVTRCYDRTTGGLSRSARDDCL